VLENNQISNISALSGLENLTNLLLGSNQISDISSLISNQGLDSWDEIYLEENPLGGRAVYYDIPILEEKNVIVYYDIPAWIDTDGDSIPDLWEKMYDEPSEVTDPAVLPLDPTVDDGDSDNDSDGRSKGISFFYHINFIFICNSLAQISHSFKKLSQNRGFLLWGCGFDVNGDGINSGTAAFTKIF